MKRLVYFDVQFICGKIAARTVKIGKEITRFTRQAQWRSGQHAGFQAERSRVRIPAMSLFYWVATLVKLFTHIGSPVFSGPRNWGYSEWIDSTA